jgi:uncharacterized membrane protein
MANLVAAVVFFLGIHFGISGTALRARLVNLIGERVFRGLFALTSIAGLIWLIRAYSTAPYIQTWGRLIVLEPLAQPLVLIAALFVVIGVSTPSPTTAGMESQLTRGVQVRGITRITRHPFLWGVALWAFVHFVINGDLAAALVFGSLLLLAVVGTSSIDAKRRRAYGESWEQFSRETSNVPFAAILQRRNSFRPALREIGVARPLIAIAIFAALFLLHGRLFGAPLT